MSWEKVKLDELCKMNSGGTPSRSNLTFYNGNIPWAKISDIENAEGGIIKYTEEHITPEGLSAINNRIFEKGTLLLAMYGSVGKVAFAGMQMTSNQAILGIKIKDENRISYSYLKYWFQTIKEQLLNRAVGGTLQNISLGIVKDLEIPLPPLATQKRIAEILDKADALRRKDQELLKKYDDLAQAIFIDMFGDPVKNEKGWEVKTIGSITKVGSGSTPSRQNLSFFEGNIPWVKTTEVNGEIILKTEEAITEEALAKSSCKLYPKDSVIVAMYGQGKTRGQVGILGIEATTNQACGVILPCEILNPKFLFNYLKLSYSELGSLGRGGNQENLNKGMIEDFLVIIPPIELQEKFNNIVDNLYLQKLNSDEKISNSLFQTLLQKAFKGELD